MWVKLLDKHQGQPGHMCSTVQSLNTAGTKQEGGRYAQLNSGRCLRVTLPDVSNRLVISLDYRTTAAGIADKKGFFNPSKMNAR